MKAIYLNIFLVFAVLLAVWSGVKTSKSRAADAALIKETYGKFRMAVIAADPATMRQYLDSSNRDGSDELLLHLFDLLTNSNQAVSANTEVFFGYESPYLYPYGNEVGAWGFEFRKETNHWLLTGNKKLTLD